MLHGPPHGALHVLALVNNGARTQQNGNSITPAQVTSIKGKSVGLTVLAGDRSFILVGFAGATNSA
jgi:hypothetical protein